MLPTRPSAADPVWVAAGRYRQALARLTPEALAALAPDEAEWLTHDWLGFARADQWPPPGDWRTWLVMGGRGSGKTRAGAEWVRGAVHGRPGFAASPCARVALVGETLAAVREVMVEGVSGLRAIALPGERPRWEVTRRRLVWPNGAVAEAYSSEDPESLRGPQFDAAWADEAGKWAHPDATWDMLAFGLRLGAQPRTVITTTPRPVPLLRRVLADPATRVTRSSTFDNIAHLAPGFVAALEERYGGTRLGRQELDGELIEDREGALFSRATIEAARLRSAPALERIVVAVDPPATSGHRADACGLVAAGLADGIVYVLADETGRGLAPDAWAARAAGLYHALEADALVVEVNQGGEMVEAIMREVAPDVPVTPVRATRSKRLRAEPVAALYARGRVKHAGHFPLLEDEMADFGPDGLSAGRSPDRLDALVWAVTHLALARRGEARVRGL
jgi:phage terminase large subunit-like protein